MLETIAYFFGSECPRTINRGDSVNILLYWVTCNTPSVGRLVEEGDRIDVVEGVGIFCSPIPLFPFPPLPRTPQVAEVY